METKYGGMIILEMTHRLYLIHVHFSIKFHEDIPNDYQVMGCTRMKITQNKQKKNPKKTKGHNPEKQP